ncbi:MAG: hypothetical protein E7290_09140 [Lachnospiraceae bacterium]|nr:hypothetical protein [Lachnospiraceae bacterium]
MANNQENETLSKSKAKRENRHKEVTQQKKKRLLSNIIFGVITTAIVVFFVFAIAAGIYQSATRTTSSSDFSACLTDDGLIKDVEAASVVTLADYESLVVPMSEVVATQEEVDTDIQAMLEDSEELSTDASLTIADGDVVNIDYVGSIDGVEFEGGNSGGTGYDLTIGSGSFIDDFEQQLIGHAPGEEVTVEVTFPEEYSNNPDLAGKDASFAVTIHGIYVIPEFNDEFVTEYLSDVASNTEEYIAYVENFYYEQHLQEYIENYIFENSTVNKYPSAYLKNVKSTTKYGDESTVSYYNQMLGSYGMSYTNPWDIMEGIENEADYEKDLTARAKDTVKAALIYQAIYEKAGLSFDVAAYMEELVSTSSQEYVDGMIESYGGQGALMQSKLVEVVDEYLMDTVTVE